MGKFKKYITLFRTIQRYKWVRIAVYLWSFISFYDQVLSQLIPKKISEHAPRTWEIIIMTGNLLPFWGWLLILAVILIFALAEYSIRLTRQSKSKESKQPKDERIAIRRLGDQVSRDINGKTLAAKWGIKLADLLNMIKKRDIRVYNAEMSAIMNASPADDVDLYLDTYKENNETQEDVILRWMFKPEDIREFEEKVRNGLLPEYVLLKTKWKRSRKIKREDMKHS